MRVLHDLYPDFAIDVGAEQAALKRAHLVVWHHPMYWYGPPALLKHWFDKVLALGWAHGPGGRALAGKRCLWVVTTGGDHDSYAADGVHAHRFEAFVPPIRQTARFCDMQWLEPLVVHNARAVSDAAIADAARTYRHRLQAVLTEAGAAEPRA